jgi:ATP-dependent RNA helicase DHX8/PRP22
MNEVEKLEYLSLVSKVCTELENHLGMNDKDLAEFIIHLSEKHDTVDSFKKVLIENGAEFSDSFVSNLLRIIQHMRPKKSTQVGKITANYEQDSLAAKFPGLAIPNELQKPLIQVEEDVKVKMDGDDDVVADLMAQFEADAPSQIKPETKEKVREKSRSPEKSRSRHRRDRSRSRDRRSRSRDRHRNRRRARSRSRDRSSRRHRTRSRSKRRRSPTPKRRERVKVKRESPELDEDPIPGKVC